MDWRGGSLNPRDWNENLIACLEVCALNPVPANRAMVLRHFRKYCDLSSFSGSRRSLMVALGSLEYLVYIIS
jgi:hypothetical protein